jgi:hypothetical protein
MRRVVIALAAMCVAVLQLATCQPPPDSLKGTVLHLVAWSHAWFGALRGLSDVREVETIVAVGAHSTRAVVMMPRLGTSFELLLDGARVSNTSLRSFNNVHPDGKVMLGEFFRAELRSQRNSRDPRNNRFGPSTLEPEREFMLSPSSLSYLSIERWPVIEVHGADTATSRKRAVDALAFIGSCIPLSHSDCGPGTYTIPSFSGLDPEVFVVAEFAESGRCRPRILHFSDYKDSNSYVRAPQVINRDEWTGFVADRVRRLKGMIIETHE